MSLKDEIIDELKATAVDINEIDALTNLNEDVELLAKCGDDLVTLPITLTQGNKSCLSTLILMWDIACSHTTNYSINESVGMYNPTTELFELNGITNISAQQAAQILYSRLKGGACRGITNLPVPGDATNAIQISNGSLINSSCRKWVGASRLIGGEPAGTDPGWVVNSSVETMLNINALAEGEFSVGNTRSLVEIRFCRVTKNSIDISGASFDLSKASIISCLEAMIKYRSTDTVGEIKLPSLSCYNACMNDGEILSKCQTANVVLTCDELPPSIN